MIAKTEMSIRRPVAEVFEAFIDPAITTKFRFTKSSVRLETGKQIRWDWEMYNSGTDVNVKRRNRGTSHRLDRRIHLRARRAEGAP